MRMLVNGTMRVIKRRNTIMSLYTYAALTQDQLEKVQALEAEMGKRILILHEYRPEYAELNDDEFRRLMDLEGELGYVAVAVR